MGIEFERTEHGSRVLRVERGDARLTVLHVPEHPEWSRPFLDREVGLFLLNLGTVAVILSW